MLEHEFDRFADEYEQLLARDIRLSGEDPLFFAAYKAADVHRHLVEAGIDLGSLGRILDFGCGVGGSLPHLREWFPATDLVGADISRKSLDVAQRRYPDLARFVHFSGGEPLPFDDGTVDVSFSACVFHHIPHDEHDRILRDLLRVIKPGGWLFIFEHNPLNPLTVRTVKACPFDDNAVLMRSGVLKQRIRARGFCRCGGSLSHILPRRVAPLASARIRADLVPAGRAILCGGAPPWLNRGRRRA